MTDPENHPVPPIDDGPADPAPGSPDPDSSALPPSAEPPSSDRNGPAGATPRKAGLHKDREKELREKGYVLDEDAHGLRISGAPSSSGASALSPYDIVRMAADLDGGVASKDQLRKCPKCDAAMRPGTKTCQWCGEVLE
jgi:hypothetical protein